MSATDTLCTKCGEIKFFCTCHKCELCGEDFPNCQCAEQLDDDRYQGVDFFDSLEDTY